MSLSGPTSLAQWLSYIEAGHPDEIELGLTRTGQVADWLQLKQGWTCPVVTLAGTNGKGSTQAYISQIMVLEGYRVAAYSSPHLLRYNERVCLNGEPASDSQLCTAFAAVEHARQQVGVALTYFEFGTLAALWLFRQWQPELLLLEVGLGGRLDAVNIIDPDISVITTIALDHQDWLGNDREAVGYEKAGILRPATPVVYGEPDLPASVRSRAEALDCPLYHWGQNFGQHTDADSQSGSASSSQSDSASSSQSGKWRWFGQTGQGQALEYSQLPMPELPFENAATALQVIALLPLTVSQSSICQGLASARLVGRRQRIDRYGRELVLDVAHNPHAAAYLVGRLTPIVGNTWCVLGMLEDKDRTLTLEALAPAIDYWLLADLQVPRGCRAEQLVAALPEGQQGLSYASPWRACQAALEQSQPGDRVLVVGSFYTVADVLRQLKETEG
ncbi:MAG: dihydrofolate synthase/folylpolyglutamate synthase [Motiliproteus sp.]|jgi:dihydrofolate synthase/folylpolyglutamate synthase